MLMEGFTPTIDVEPRLPGQRGPSVSGGLPDFTGLTVAETLDAAERLKVRVRPQGTGIAVMQSVPPGPIEEGAVVDVLFEAPA
jgi:cell division protein FtsI (penicillin-binding protein 3)